MFGIPNQSLEDLKKDLETIIQLSPENVSIYSLIWEEGTVFWSKLQKGILSEMDQDLEAEMYEEIIDFLKKNGYISFVLHTHLPYISHPEDDRIFRRIMAF